MEPAGRYEVPGVSTPRQSPASRGASLGGLGVSGMLFSPRSHRGGCLKPRLWRCCRFLAWEPAAPLSGCGAAGGAELLEQLFLPSRRTAERLTLKPFRSPQAKAALLIIVLRVEVARCWKPEGLGFGGLARCFVRFVFVKRCFLLQRLWTEWAPAHRDCRRCPSRALHGEALLSTQILYYLIMILFYFIILLFLFILLYFTLFILLYFTLFVFLSFPLVFSFLFL